MAKTSIIFVAFVFLAVAISESHSFTNEPIFALDMIDSLLKSSANMRVASPEQNKKCFDKYTPQLGELADKYKDEINGCSDAEEAAKQAIIKEVAGNVATITQWRNEICNSYTNCKGSEPYPFFECNNQASPDALTKSYDIQTMSKDRLQYCELRSKMAEYNAESCTRKCKEAYDVNSKKVYDELQGCLNAK